MPVISLVHSTTFSLSSSMSAMALVFNSMRQSANVLSSAIWSSNESWETTKINFFVRSLDVVAVPAEHLRTHCLFQFYRDANNGSLSSMRCVERQRAPSPHERCNSCSAVRPILRTPLALSPANIPRCTMPLCRTDSLPAPPVFSFAANEPHRHWLVSGPSTFPANTFQHIRCQFVRFERPERAPLPGNGNMKRKIQYDLLCDSQFATCTTWTSATSHTTASAKFWPSIFVFNI